VAGKNSLILPCLARSDAGQMVSVENSMGIVHSSQGFLPPLSPHLPSEVEIVCEIGKRIHPQKSAKIMWHQFQKNHQTIRQSIEAVIPGFENYNQKILRPEGFYLPNPIRDQRSFPTIDRLAHFSVQSDDYWNPKNHLQLKENELLMMTIRSHDQFNTTIYGLNDRYRGVHFGRRVLFIGQQDMKLRNLKKGDRVNLVSFYQGQRREALDFVIIPYDIPEKCVATYFPEGNVLVPLESRAEKSHTPTSKSIVITIDLIS
jgi:anaerobic selenocysteine-containing dehydrogenase